MTHNIKVKRLYVAINEAGLSGIFGTHARLAVLSAITNTNLTPTVLYYGVRNNDTKWFEVNGIEVIDVVPSFAPTMVRLDAEGRFNKHFIGHWLRTCICNLPIDDDYVLYTDIDVIFSKELNYGVEAPKFFAAGPEHQPDKWNYANSGVMLMNMRNLRESYPAFEKFIIHGLEEKGGQFWDQEAYNVYYRRAWTRLPIEMNWKPYWGIRDANIVHWHGVKFDTVQAIMDGRWITDGYPHNRQLEALFLCDVPAYRHFAACIYEKVGDRIRHDDKRVLDKLNESLARYKPRLSREELDLSFMNFHMFPE